MLFRSKKPIKPIYHVKTIAKPPTLGVGTLWELLSLGKSSACFLSAINRNKKVRKKDKPKRIIRMINIFITI